MKRSLAAFVAVFWLSLLAAARDIPPREEGGFRSPHLVELVKLDATFKLDIRYATHDNFVGQPVYEEARAFLQAPAAEALVRAHNRLKEKGYGLIIFDAYRPWYVTKLFWDRFPHFREYLADPAKGSRHNRGCAVDLTLFENEWWHFDYQSWREYPILNLRASEISGAGGPPPLLCNLRRS